jgi:hypothetical protein
VVLASGRCPGARTAKRPMRHRASSWRRGAALAAVLSALVLDLACSAERSTGPQPEGHLAELHVTASVAATTIATLVVRVSAPDIQPTLIFNLTLASGVASGVLRMPAGSARTIALAAFDDAGVETHRGEKTLDVHPGANNPTVAITLIPIAGSQQLNVWLGTFAVTISPAPASVRVAETITLTASVTMTTPEGPIAVPSAAVRWATVTTGILVVDPEDGVVTGVFPGEGTIAATYAGVGDLADITVGPRLGFYVAPGGTPAGDGTWTRPWNLATALSGAGGRILPGDVVWLREGIYVGDFNSSLTGSPAAQIIVRRYPGEHATIEGRLEADGAYTTYWGFEIRQADALATNWPALVANAPGGRYVNLIVHDAGENGISFRTQTGVSEVYGCIVFNNGNNEGLDQGIYASSELTVVEKRILDNVLFNNLASGVQVFGDGSHSSIKNVTVIGNISFNNSSIAQAQRGREENINYGGDQTAVENVVVEDNLLYFSPNVSTGHNLMAGLARKAGDTFRNVSTTVRNNYVVGGETLLQVYEWQQATVEGNTLVASALENVVRLNVRPDELSGLQWNNNTHHRDPAAKAWRYNGILRSWAEFQAATGLGATDLVIATPPAANKIVIRPNAYESGRANIAIYSPTADANVSVDVSGILQAGDRYEVRNVQDIFGPPVVSGTYSGQLLVLPMAGVTPPPATGRGAAPVTGPYFNAFLLTRPEP